MARDVPDEWVLPEWPALSRRPLILGLPFGAFFLLFVVAGAFGLVLGLYVVALILMVSLWIIGAAITRYDPYGWEIRLAAFRVPRVLKCL